MSPGQVAHFQPQIVAGPLPAHPADLVAEDFRGQRLGVFGGGDGDDRVGVGVIHMRGGDERMQRRVDGSGPGVEIIDAVGVEGHHFVFDGALDAFRLGPVVDGLQTAQFVHIEAGKVGPFGGAQVAAGAFDPHHFDGFAAEGVGHHHFGRGVAAAGVGDALVRAQEIGAVDQTLHRVECGGCGVVPQVVDVLEVGCHSLLSFVQGVMAMQERV